MQYADEAAHAKVAEGFPVGKKVVHRGSFEHQTPYKCLAYQSGSYVSSGNAHNITIDTAEYDPMGLLDKTNNRIKAPVAGIYMAVASAWDQTGAGNMSLSVLVNGTVQRYVGFVITAQILQGSCLLKLSGGDYVSAQVSAPNTNTMGGGSDRSYLHLHYLSST